MKNVIVIGGGLAGLINAILLSRAGLTVTLFEVKKYPFHRVCGEYISNEIVPFMKKNELFPTEFSPSEISRFHLSSISGKSLKMPLDLGGIGISRKSYDQWLAEKAKSTLDIVHARVVSSSFNDDHFIITDKDGKTYKAKVIIGAYGKRSILDKSLRRSFIQKKYPYIGVKYHIRTDEVDNDIVELHNFINGYCGVNKIENNTFNLCYLSHRSNLKRFGSIEVMEEEVLKKNLHLKRIFNHSDFLFDKPEVINEITFERKEPVYDHILMSGDSAGMITPLCGNGMAMAIHSANILSKLIIECFDQGFDRQVLEQNYTNQWNSLFAKRLWAGRNIQKLFGSPIASEVAVVVVRSILPIARFLMKQTHGSPFS